MNLREVVCNDLLARVQRPSRYLGTEVNTVHKKPAAVDVRIALVFPDLYDLGLGNLGLLILYALLNDLPWCWAERAYAPAADMEAALRERGLPLFTNESKTPLGEMDAIAFTLQSELTYTNILTILDLAGIPLRTQDRAAAHPLTFAGGPGAFNPEPLAPFMDFFVIGDGEEIIIEIAEHLRALKGRPRTEKLNAISALDGVYVPALHDAARPIIRRLVTNLDTAAFPTRYIVPFTQQVHDRISLEALRGCTHGCRFCQAGMTGRPVRERSISRLGDLMKDTLHRTGYEEVSLVSLSTCDHSRVRMLVAEAAAQAHADNVAVSLPSLRLDSFSVELAGRLTGVRRSGLTFAPEAATPRLRAVINKWSTDEELLEVAAAAFRLGWEHVKLYFMIGLPSETDEDVAAIADLCLRVLRHGRTISQKARVHTGVATFVPKPLTPFQWAEQISVEETRRRQDIIERGFGKQGGIKFGRHNAETSFVEGLISRGDRRTADLIEAAWRRGARFDSWDEQLNMQAWYDAIAERGYDVAGALGARNPDGPLPWDHIDVLIPKAWLRAEWERATTGQCAEDCRRGVCNQCGVNSRVPELCREMLDLSETGRMETEETPRPSPEPRVEPEPVQRLRIRIGREGEARYLSHLEWMNAWTRALRRSSTPLSYSQGFHAHPKVAFAAAAPVGEESVADYMDIILSERIDPQTWLKRLQETVPVGFHAFEAGEVSLKAPSLMSAVSGFAYTLYAETDDVAGLRKRIEEILASDSVTIARNTKVKHGRREVREMVPTNIRPLIGSLALHESSGPCLATDPDVNPPRSILSILSMSSILSTPSTPSILSTLSTRVAIDFTTPVINGKSARPREIIDLLGLDSVLSRIVKRETRLS